MYLTNPNSGIANSLNNLHIQSNELTKSTIKLSTGKKVVNSSDSPSDIGRITSFKKTIRGLNAANENIQDALGYLHQRDAAMSIVENMMLRIRDIAVRASNTATLSDADRDSLQEEATSIIYAINNINEIGNFQNMKLFQKTFETVPGGTGGLVHPGQVSITIDLASMAVGGKVEIYGAWYDGSAAFPDFNLISPDGSEAFGYLYSSWSNPYSTGIETYLGGSGPSTVNNGAPGNSGYGTMNSATKIKYSGWGGYNGAGGWDEESFTVYDPAPGLWTIIIDNEQPVPKQFGLFYNESASDPTDTKDNVFISGDVYNDEVSLFSLESYEVSANALGMSANFSTQASSNTSLQTIDKALAKLADHRAGDGAKINALSSILDSNNSVIMNSEAARSNIEDADIAEESTQLIKTQILSQGATMALSHNMDSQQAILDLLYQNGVGEKGGIQGQSS